MTLVRYEVLLTVSRLKSFTKAAEELNMTQSGVSHAIKSLEDELGFPLITRNKRGITPTSEGKMLLNYINEIIQLERKIKQEVDKVHGIETGEIRIGSFSSVTSLWLPHIFYEFQKDYPNVRLILYEGVYKEIEEMLLNGEIDCGFIVAPVSKELEYIHLKNDPLVCIVSKSHELSNEEKITIEQLEKEQFIVPQEGGDLDVVKTFNKYNIRPEIKFKVIENQTILSLVEKGLGISIIAKMVLDSNSADIRALKLEDNLYRSIIIATNKYISPLTEKFIEYVVRFVKNQM
jgi:DNA-binding transcriptional LysR family regulator